MRIFSCIVVAFVFSCSKSPEIKRGEFPLPKDVEIANCNVGKYGGIFVMDIGDSQFAGVHIPTHDILSEIYGFKLTKNVIYLGFILNILAVVLYSIV